MARTDGPTRKAAPQTFDSLIAEECAKPLARMRCGIAKFLDAVPDDEREAIIRALTDPGIQHRQIERALRTLAEQSDYPAVSYMMVIHHRNGACQCPSSTQL